MASVATNVDHPAISGVVGSADLGIGGNFRRKGAVERRARQAVPDSVQDSVAASEAQQGKSANTTHRGHNNDVSFAGIYG